MLVKKDNYTPLERQEYNRHYYPNNKERMQKQRRTPLAVHRRKLNRLKHRYEAQITSLLEKMTLEINQLHDELKLAQASIAPDSPDQSNGQS